ncbi:PKD domain-containing protein [Halorubrum distributum]|uniref:PKD domain-containing protein n=1 Tax=Halorubrum distributum TaxID=29283 RepID=UPI000ADF7CC6|nr:PKD domain-containing protein [Halorubrum distributum]
MRFSRDRRGQSVVVGTVILFGFLILALSLYQVQIVPQENAEVEFQHFEEVRNDLVDLRAGILTAGQADTPQFKSVELGTNYPTRLFAINPPPPTGTLQTSDAYNVTITNGTETVTIPSRFLSYTPGYNELSRTPTRYDGSVLYLDGRERGENVVVIEEQSLVDDGTVRLTVLQNEYRRSGTQRATVELYPTNSTSTDGIPTGEVNITIPTRLNASTYWDGAIGDESVYTGVEDDRYAEGVHGLTLRANSDDTRVNTVGIQESPNEGPVRENVRSPSAGDPGDDPTPDISMRVDDLTDRRSNNPDFYVSYDYGGQFDEIEVSATSTESTARVTRSLSSGRNGTSLSPTFGDGQEFAVTVRAIRGGQTVAQRTIYTFADTQNPIENDDLSRSDSASIEDYVIEDQSNKNDVRYRFNYDVSQTGSFSEGRFYVLNRNGNGASGSRNTTDRSVNNFRVEPGDGTNTPYKVSILVLDANGVVVDSRTVDDTADGTDP